MSVLRLLLKNGNILHFLLDHRHKRVVQLNSVKSNLKESEKAST